MLRQSFWGSCVFVVAVVLATISNTANAGATEGVQWLVSHAQSDGSLATPTDIAIPSQSTAEALRALDLAGGAPSSTVAAASQYLASQTYLNTETLSRIIINAAINGQNPAALIVQLRLNQDSVTGGFGEAPGYQPSVLDTAFALEALVISGNLTSAAASSAVTYLRTVQATNGSWADNGNDPSIYLTALSLSSLSYYSTTSGIAAAMQKASSWLLSARGSDGLWGDDFQSAESLIALQRALTDRSPITANLQALKAHQGADGSWGEDAFVTAVALRAAFDASNLSAGSANVQGYVRLAGSSQGISGAAVSIASLGLMTQTDADGYYLFSGVPKGVLTLSATKAGYGSSSTSVQAVSARTVSANDLILGLSTQAGAVVVRLFDSSSSVVISGATVTLSGASSRSGVTDGTGKVEFSNAVPGFYTASIQASGYPAVQGTFTVTGGQTLTLNQPISKSGSTNTPVNLVATIINGSTGAVVSGATLNLGSGYTAISGSNGIVTINNVPPGSYAGTLSANGFVSGSYSLIVVGGQNGNLGALSLYPTTTTTAPTTVTVVGTVLNGSTNNPVSGASVNVVGTSLTATSNAQGQFTLSGITSLSFQLQISATGFSTGVYSSTSSGFGSVSSTFVLSPTGSTDTTINVHGHVTDSATGNAIPGATVTTADTGLSVQTDDQGAYTLNNLASTLSLQFSAANYADQNFGGTVSGPGSYLVDVKLDPSPQSQSQIQIVTLSTNDAGKGANQVETFDAAITNAGDASQEVILAGYIVDADGKQVAAVSPYASGTTTLQSIFAFSGHETKNLQIAWNTVQAPPGSYKLVLDVVQPGTITRTTPKGTILTESSTTTSVSQTQAVSGALALQPPLTQSGSTDPVVLDVLVANAGNVPLYAVPAKLKITFADATSTTFTATLPDLKPGEFEYVHFGNWVPDHNGNLAVAVSAQDAGVSGSIAGSLYVGDKPTGAFAVTPTTVFTGTQTVHATIDTTGVDKTINVSSPLVTQIKTAISKGITYVSTNVRADQNATHCLRCHVQSQSYFGLASLLGHDVGSDPDTTQFVYNAISSSQQDDGRLLNAYAQWPIAQTSINLWALSKTPDKISSFPLKYRAAKYLQAHASTSGDKTSWIDDYNGAAWFQGTDAHTMLTVQGLVDVVLTARNNDLSGVNDYSVATATETAPAGSNDWTVGPDNAIYSVRYATSGASSIYRYDPDAGVVTTVATGLPSLCSSVYPAATNEFFVACHLNMIHVLPNGTKVAVPASLSNAEVGGITRGPDGLFYIADSGNNRIMRGPATGPFTVFASGGLINRPYGVVFAPDGSLYVGNVNGFNILKIAPDATVSIYSQSLGFPPIYMALNPDGSMFVSLNAYTDGTSGTGTTDGMLYIDNKGIARRIFTQLATRGIATVNGKTYFGVYNAGTIRKIVTAPVDTSQLPAISTLIDNAARYAISRYPSSPNIFVWITLCEAKKVVTDPALLAQINTAIASIDTTIRSRQRADGGWNWSFNATSSQASDAIATALAATGLAYSTPPGNDVAAQKALTFLLNSQKTDGSWVSADGVMTTNFAASGLVMSYLPIALDAIGGLNLELHVNTPATATLSNPNLPPSGNLPLTGGGRAYTWTLGGVTSQGRQVTFDLSLANLVSGEDRPAVSSSYVLSTNSFNSSQVQVDLQIPNVHAADGLALTALSADKPNYLASDTALLSAQVSNIAPATQSGSVIFTITSVDDGSVVATLPEATFSGLGSGQNTLVNSAWPIGGIRSGQYLVTADLYDGTHFKTDQKTTSLVVLGTGTGNDAVPAASLRVTTDRQSYHTTDQVNVSDLAQNLTVNAPITAASLVVQVFDPATTQVFTQTLSLGELAPGSVTQRGNVVALNRVAQGVYTATGKLLDANGAVLAQDAKTFTVTEDLTRSVRGLVAAQSATLVQGQDQLCTHTVTNTGTVDLTGLQVQMLLVRLDVDQLVNTINSTADLAVGAHATLQQPFSTGPLTAGDYSCVLQANIGNDWTTLSNAVFVVKPEPTQLTTTVATDSPVYESPATVQITGKVNSLMHWRTVSGASVHFDVVSPTGVHTGSDVSLSSIAPGATLSVPTTYAVTGPVEGTYTVTDIVLNSGADVAPTASTSFLVRKTASQAITGTTTAEFPSVIQGEPESCTDIVSSSSQYALQGVQLRRKLIRTDVYKLIETLNSTVDLAANGSQTLSRSVATGPLTAGQYACKLDLMVGGTWKPLASAAFTVKPEPTHLSTTVSTDKPSYESPADVQITGVVNSLMQWRTVTDGTVHFDVISPSGANVYAVDLPMAALAPGATLSVPTDYNLASPVEGDYTVNDKVLDADGIQASASTKFSVHKTQAQALKGNVTAQSPSLYQGDTQTCTDKVSSTSQYALAGVKIRQQLLNTDTGTTVNTTPSTVDLAANGSQTLTRTFSTSGYALGHYSCSLDANINGTWTNLASAAFEVTAPPVRVDAGLGLGSKGRLLVLMDSPTDHSSGGALCASHLADATFEIDLNKNLSPSAVVEVKLLNSLGLIVDQETTSLRSFTGEVNGHAGSNQVDLSIVTLTTDELVVALAGTGADHVLSGTYKLVANVTDSLGNLTFNSGLFSLTCNTISAVGDTVGQVLKIVGINNSVHTGTGIGDGNDTVSAAAQKTYLKGLLDLDGWSYDIVTDKDQFAAGMRGGAYQNYALLSEYQVLDDQVQRELRENVYGNAGLLNAGRHDVRRRILDNPLGIEYRGTQLSPVGVQMLAGSPYLAGQQTSFGQGNQVQRTTLMGATLDGNVISGVTTQQTSLVTHNAYGLGKSAYSGFDLLAEASASGNSSGVFANLIRQPLALVNPPQTTPLAGRVVPVRLTLANQNVANTSDVTVTASMGAYIVKAGAGTITSGHLNWSTTLDAGQTKTLDLWVQLPDANIPVTLTAIINSHSDLYTAAPVTVTYALTPVVRPSLDGAIADLKVYVAAQPAPGLLGFLLDPLLGIKTPAAAALDQLKAADADLANGRVDKALAELVKATDYLINDGSISLKPIRLEVDEAIFQTEKLQ